MKVYTCSEARRRFVAIVDEARFEGSAPIRIPKSMRGHCSVQVLPGRTLHWDPPARIQLLQYLSSCRAEVR